MNKLQQSQVKILLEDAIKEISALKRQNAENKLLFGQLVALATQQDNHGLSDTDKQNNVELRINEILREFKYSPKSKFLLGDESYAAAIQTINSNSDCCSNCGCKLPRELNYFKLQISFDSQTPNKLFGHNGSMIQFNHPAIQSNSGYQDITISSGRSSQYKLCWECHNEFAALIGDFLMKGIMRVYKPINKNKLTKNRGKEIQSVCADFLKSK
jgi:hypothetical protein